MIRKTIVVVIYHLIAITSMAQTFGGNPSRIKWRQINTDTAKIIFPEGLDSTAQRVASIVHTLQKNHNQTIGTRVNKIPIVLQNQPTISNGYVGLGPFRSEFYLFAPQNSFDLGGLNWADNLSLHEYRHVQQYNNFNVGLSKIARVIFGQEGQALANAAAVPDWFFEGDAVFNETVLSEQGRGRVPNFFAGYKSLYQSKKTYSYMKLRNGSLKHFIPDHYELGYLLVGYGREKYGKEFWKNITQDAARFRPLFYPMQGAVKKYSGSSFKTFVDDAFKFYQSQWDSIKTGSGRYITPASTYPTDYKYPYLFSNDSYIVLKRGYRQVPAFFKVYNDGNQQKIATKSIAYDDYYSYNNGQIVYSSLNPHIRWGYKQFGDIRLLNVETGKERVVSKGQRYFAPDISHDGKQIVAVNMHVDQSSSLVLMDLSSKKIMEQPSKDVFTQPKFSADDKYIYTMVRSADSKMALQKIRIDKTEPTVTIVPFGNRVLGFTMVQGDTILFSSSFKGSDEIWAFTEKDKKVYRVATNPTGLYQGVNTKGQLVSSNFTSIGYRLIQLPATSLLWQEVPMGADALPDLYISKALSQESNQTLQNVPPGNYPISKYRKASGLFNFHSWRPNYEQPEFSFSLYGQNVLNTFQSELAYTYNQNEGSHKIGFNGIYGGWFIQPTVGINQTWNRTVRLNRDTLVNYNELNGNIGVTLPMNFTSGKQFRTLTLSSSLNTQQVSWIGIGKRLLRNQDFNYLQSRVTYIGQVQKTAQQIYPRWAQTLVAQYRTIINKYTAQQFLLSGSAYLPGAAVNHNIIVSAAYQSRDTMRQYLFGNSFPFSRGYTSIDYPRLWRIGFNYHYPLLYPDFGLANIVYFKRVRANTFYDYTVGKSLRTGKTQPFGTVGQELFFDTRWWNQQDVSFGIRYNHLLHTNLSGTPNRWEIILPISLF